jgi:hypothetical protein
VSNGITVDYPVNHVFTANKIFFRVKAMYNADATRPGACERSPNGRAQERLWVSSLAHCLSKFRRLEPLAVKPTVTIKAYRC